MIGASTRTLSFPFSVWTKNMSSTVCSGVAPRSMCSASESFPLQEKTMKATAAAVAVIFPMDPVRAKVYLLTRTVVVAVRPPQETV